MFTTAQGEQSSYSRNWIGSLSCLPLALVFPASAVSRAQLNCLVIHVGSDVAGSTEMKVQRDEMSSVTPKKEHRPMWFRSLRCKTLEKLQKDRDRERGWREIVCVSLESASFLATRVLIS